MLSGAPARIFALIAGFTAILISASVNESHHPTIVSDDAASLQSPAAANDVQSLRDSSIWSQITTRHDIFDACYDLNVSKLTHAMYMLTVPENFPYREALQIALEANGEVHNVSLENQRWTFIEVIFQFARNNGEPLKYFCISTSASKRSELKRRIKSLNIQNDANQSSGSDTTMEELEKISLESLASEYNGVLENIPSNLVKQAIQKVKNIDEVNLLFPQILSSPDLNPYHLMLINSKISRVSKPALMIAVEKILPQVEQLFEHEHQRESFETEQHQMEKI